MYTSNIEIVCYFVGQNMPLFKYRVKK